MHERKRHFLELLIPPLIVCAVFAAFSWLLARAMPDADVSIPARDTAAGVIAAISGLFGGGSIISFIHARTTVNPHKPGKASSLVTTGLNAFTRNPMYLSLLLLLTAWAVWLSNFAAFLPIPFFVAYMNRFQIVPEERMLKNLFGSEFETYCRRVRRWL